jgi:hypothetical protein
MRKTEFQRRLMPAASGRYAETKSQSRQHGAKRPEKPAPAAAVPNPALQPPARWQRTQRYAWDKGGSKGGRK